MRDKIRVGLVGVGGRGTDLLRQVLRVDGAQVTAVCDAVPERVSRAQERVGEAGGPKPAGYADYERMCGEEDLALVIVATD